MSDAARDRASPGRSAASRAGRLVGHGAPDRDRDGALPAARRRVLLLRFKTDGAGRRHRSPIPKLAKPLLVTPCSGCDERAAVVRGSCARTTGTSERRLDLALGARPRYCVPRLSRSAGPASNSIISATGTNAYGSIYYTLHRAHARARRSRGSARALGLLRCRRVHARTPSDAVRVTSLYWHFVNVVAVIVFLVLYLSPGADDGRRRERPPGTRSRSRGSASLAPPFAWAAQLVDRLLVGGGRLRAARREPLGRLDRAPDRDRARSLWRASPSSEAWPRSPRSARAAPNDPRGVVRFVAGCRRCWAAWSSCSRSCSAGSRTLTLDACRTG